MKKLRYTAMVSALLAGMTGNAMAAADGDFYGAIDLGQSTQSNFCGNGATPAGFTCEKKASVFRIAGGYQFDQNVAFEASYGHYGTAKFSGASAGFSGSGNQAAKGLQLSVIGMLPLTKEFALTAKLGIANTTMTPSGSVTIAAGGVVPAGVAVFTPSTKTSTTWVYGIGAQYSLTPTIALRAQYENLGQIAEVNGTTKTGLSLLSAGLVFAF